MGTPSPKSAVAVTLVAGALGLAACGGGEEELTAAELRALANAACEDYNARLAQVRPAETFEQVPAFLERTDPLLDDLISDLEGLEPPEELSEDYDRLLAEYREVRDTIDAVQVAAEARDARKLRAIGERAQEQTAAVEAVAGDLGLEDCGAETG